ncbi:MAG: hypothetical protein K0S23_2564 [Fluviicola sp.]|nr:hypothetical protein [Fluviicola sp.]
MDWVGGVGQMINLLMQWHKLMICRDKWLILRFVIRPRFNSTEPKPEKEKATRQFTNGFCGHTTTTYLHHT